MVRRRFDNYLYLICIEIAMLHYTLATRDKFTMPSNTHTPHTHIPHTYAIK